MTNEELAIQIQLGHSEHYSELWQNVQPLMKKILYSKMKQLSLPIYITAEDLEQNLYFAFCKAVQQFDETKPFRFTSYLSRHIFNIIREELPTKPLQEVSYNCLITQEDDTELIDLFEDTQSQQIFETLELTDLQMKVRQAVAQLPPKECRAINLYYFSGNTYKQLADKMSCSVYRANKCVFKGLQLLRNKKELKELAKEFIHHYNHTENKYYKAVKMWSTSEYKLLCETDI